MGLTIEEQYRRYKEAIGIIRMIAGGSYDNLNRMAAWCAVRAGAGLKG
jgi:hypothetical protein